MRTVKDFASPARALRSMARAIAPRKRMLVSDWADNNRVLSTKGSSIAGQWRTSRNPPLREPMDACSSKSGVRDVSLMFPIQFGKTEVEVNALGYFMTEAPGPIMVCLPGEVSMDKWVNQKLNPLIEETPAVRDALRSVSSRDASNTKTFKDFVGGQLYIEHAGSPSRLKSTTVQKLLVDELDEFANNLKGGDDPGDMLDGRTSAFPATSMRVYISSPQIKGRSRIEEKFEKGDQRRYHVPCPHCGHMQHLQWSGLQWAKDLSAAWYVCQENGCCIDEHHKTALIAAGQWIPGNPNALPGVRSYHINCLYYQFGLGPTWLELARMWMDAQGDPAKLKTFTNDRLAETWEDASMRAVRHNAIAERAEAYALREAPVGVLYVTAGVDTQDDRLEVTLTGWGRGMAFWVLDHHVLPGDPAHPATFAALTEYLQKPIARQDGVVLRIEATAQDMAGHRTDEVKHWVRQALVRRPMAIQGAIQNNAPLLGKPRLLDVTYKGVTDKKGVRAYYVGTVAAKNWLFGRLSVDAERPFEERMTHFSHELEPSYFAGLVSETYNPAKNRYEKKRGARNEPLDTFVYSYAAAHHPELRLHRMRGIDWDNRERQLLAQLKPAADGVYEPEAASQPAPKPVQPQQSLQAQRRRPTPQRMGW